MKVGTDGVLLGAWVALENRPDFILDIGAGTGLIALMLAQRSGAETIDAVELDAEAFEQCVDNFETSPWADRLFCYHADFAEFADQMEASYDLIVSNPPYYAENVSSGDASRDRARQFRALPMEVLLNGVVRLLAPEGRFCLILPFKEEIAFLKEARTRGLFPARLMRVKGNPQAPVKRSLLELIRQEGQVAEETLIIEGERHEYTPEYRALTRDFYLKM